MSLMWVPLEFILVWHKRQHVIVQNWHFMGMGQSRVTITALSHHYSPPTGHQGDMPTGVQLIQGTHSRAYLQIKSMKSSGLEYKPVAEGFEGP